MNPWQIVKDCIGAAAVIALIVGAIYVQHWRTKAGMYDQAVAATAQVQSDFDSYRQSVADRDKASAGFQHELQTLHDDFGQLPPPIVRLCPPAAGAAPVPAAAPVAAGPVSTAPAAGVVHGSVDQGADQGPDIGPDLYAIAHRADELSAQLRAVQAYKGTSHAPE